MNFTGLIRKFLIGAVIALAPAASFAGIFVSVRIAPPELPVYVQPVCPGDGYLWNPGYWAYGDEGYYWVPGVWVQPPSVGLLWTPGYWGFNNGFYVFNAGYWGPHVGFYGGINYGFGFGGSGFYGGEWRGGRFAYNTAYSNVNTTVIHNTYINRTTINNTTINNSHTSFNGGQGGVQYRPNAREADYQHENHIAPTSEQQSHLQAAHSNPGNFARANGGRPQMAAIQRPGATNTAVAARGFNGATVNQRAGNQQQRVAQGVRSGQLTAGETRNIESRDASINHQAQADRAANDGRLNQQQHQQINQRQNNVSGSIYQDKHNAAVQPRAQAQPEPRPQVQQAPRPQPQQARPQPQARPQQQARPQAAPRPQAESHGGEHGHR